MRLLQLKHTTECPQGLKVTHTAISQQDKHSTRAGGGGCFDLQGDEKVTQSHTDAGVLQGVWDLLSNFLEDLDDLGVRYDVERDFALVIAVLKVSSFVNKEARHSNRQPPLRIHSFQLSDKLEQKYQSQPFQILTRQTGSMKA